MNARGGRDAPGEERTTPGRWEEVGRWRLWLADADGASAAQWVEHVERLVARERSLHRSKHADTYRWTRSGGDVYVKVYRRYRRWTALKDWFRPSKAENVRRMSAALQAADVCVPRVLAIGEERAALGVSRSWCATAGLAGEPVGARLGALARSPERSALRAKRGILGAVGTEVARLHTRGIVAGDLVPANVWISVADAEARVAFLDHDRTRIGNAPVAWRRGRRNLVQLNRVVLPGVGATDRLRVYRAYATAHAWSPREARRRLQWIIAKTVARRRAERRAVPIPATVDFRTLMRAGGPYAPHVDEPTP